MSDGCVVNLNKSNVMEAYRTKGRAENGKLVIGIPKEFDLKVLEVIVLAEETNQDFDNLHNKEERKERLMKIVGAAKHPDFSIDKYDVYDQ